MLYVSKDENCLYKAMDELGFPKLYFNLVLIAKKLIDPKYVPNKVFTDLFDKNSYLEKKEIFSKPDNIFKEWI